MKLKRIAFLSLFLLAIAVHRASAQGAPNSLAEKLGFPRDAKLLSLSPADIVIDHTITIDPSVASDKWADFYKTALKNLQPGVTEFVIHLGFADDEMKAATRERDTWGAAWRQRDFDFFTSSEFRQLLASQNIKLITWREIAAAAKK